jgi:hypothetical protein
MLSVQKKRCKTCIYHANSNLDLAILEKAVELKFLVGYYDKYCICYYLNNVVCNGFYMKYKDNCTLIQLVQCLNVV